MSADQNQTTERRRAQVCRQEVVNGDGAGTMWFVRLPDGYLLQCGFGFQSDERAAEVAERLNESYAGRAS